MQGMQALAQATTVKVAGVVLRGSPLRDLDSRSPFSLRDCSVFHWSPLVEISEARI
jgi:hypothetical protein